jgi:Rieske 2Fe-2S family protein
MNQHASIANQYASGFGLAQDVLFDQARAERLFTRKWFFAGTRGDIPNPRDYLNFQLFDDHYFLLHGSDGVIRCMVNRCSHQSARLVKADTGRCAASLICPNHQWAYNLNDGSVRNAPGLGPDFPNSPDGKARALRQIPVVELDGLLFACLSDTPDHSDMDEIRSIIAPYAAPFGLGKGGYKLAHHHREILDASWLLVMINNRECCHCSNNHRGLLKLFDPSSFNGARTPAYQAMLDRAIARWEDKGLAWQEQAFTPNDCARVARYPINESFKSITFDGAPASRKLIGPFDDYDPSTLSMWFNPNAWVHFTSDHIATNWVLPLGPDKCALYSSWIVHEDAVEGEDYDVDHLTEVWKVTNAEDVELCRSMTDGARSRYYSPGPFAPDERHCIQFCDWYMTHSA